MEPIQSFTELISSIPDFIEGFLEQQPKVIMQTKCIKFAFDFLGDALSNVVLTICCVILLSYLRQAVPKLKVNPRFIGLLTFPAFCGLLQRFAAKLERPAGLPHFEDTLLSLAIHLCRPSNYNSEQIGKFNKLMEDLNINLTYSNWLEQNGLSFCMTIFFSALAFFSICTAALRIMGVRKKKHAVPMIGLIVVCIIIRFCLKPPYEALMDFIFDNIINVERSSEHLTLAYNLFIYGSIMLIAMIIYMCRTMQTKDKFKKVLPHILYLIGFILFYTVFNICANTSKLEYPIILLFSFILTFTFMIFFLIYGMKKPYRLIQEDVERQNKDDEYREDAKSYNRGNKEIDKFNHDLPNNLTMIEETASNENAEKTAELVHSLLENLIKARKGFVSGNDFLDTVLYKENEKAKAAEIEITFDGIFPEKGIEIFDISTIFCNALDNAIEACREAEKPSSIDFVSKIKGDYVYFKIINPYKTIKTDKKNNLITTKEDTKSHGFGLNNIKEAIKKYDGTLDITHEDGVFTLSAKLRFKNSEE